MMNLKNQLNEKNVLNKKLYGENNNLFQALEGKTCDNQNLQDQLCHQETIISRLNSDKYNLQNTINNLNNTITIQPAPIQTNLNFGQNLGIQFVNTNPNNFNNIRYNIIPNKTANYEFRKKYNVSLVKK